MSEIARTDGAPNFGVEATLIDAIAPPAVDIPGRDVPVRHIDTEQLKSLGYNLSKLFFQYRSDRRIQELRWLRNLRQYLGFYDPEVEKTLAPERSRAYPKLTRVKCITLQAHIIDLMFPSDDKNWTIKARPSPDMDIDDIKVAIAGRLKEDKGAGLNPTVDLDYAKAAMQDLADKRAADLTVEIEDQLQELGGDQSYDYVALNNEVVQSSIEYGIGLLRGPYARKVPSTEWSMVNGVPQGRRVTKYMPQFELLSVWDFYPDMAAKRLEDGDGYFTRKVMSRHQVKELGKRPDFFADVIDRYLSAHTIGNYRPEPFETELRAMGVKVNVNEMKIESTKYEVIVWHGHVSGNYLKMAGVDVPADKLSDEIESEVWLLDGYVVKADMNPWAALGMDVKTLHYFLFDRDDTAPIGFGLPNVMRDTQMTVSASTRMMLDNAAVTCGPIMEMNTNLLRPDQDLTSFGAYKMFYRDDDGVTAQFDAVRSVNIEAHLSELASIIEQFVKWADIETFVGPMTGGDMANIPSEPMRNAAGASMLLGKAALPFKQIIRNFDRFTESVIQSLVQFNRKFNPDSTKPSDYDVIARGATSLIAKEFRGMQIDSLVTTLTPDEQLHVDDRKMAEARFAVRDLTDMLVPPSVAEQRKAQRDAAQAQQQQQQSEFIEATIRKTLADALKNISQGQKNQMAASAQAVDAALAVLEHDALGALHGTDRIDSGGRAAPESDQDSAPADSGGVPGTSPAPAAPLQGPAVALPAAGFPGQAGGGPGV